MLGRRSCFASQGLAPGWTTQDLRWLRYHGAMRLLALLLIAVPLFAAESANLKRPLKSPVARRLRVEAKSIFDKANAIREAMRKKPAPTDEQVRQAFRDAAKAIETYEKAQRVEWDPSTNQTEQDCVRLWVMLRKQVKPEPAPEDPEEKLKWEKKREKRLRSSARDARRFLTTVMNNRRHSKLFKRCPRCDGRGKVRSSFGDSRNCGTCSGHGHTASRRGILDAHWYPFSPFYRSVGQRRTNIDFVLTSGVAGESKVSPFTKSVVVKGKVEDHGWWYRVRTKEKVFESGNSKKSTEREGNYVVVHVGRVWWLVQSQADHRDLSIPVEDS